MRRKIICKMYTVFGMVRVLTFWPISPKIRSCLFSIHPLVKKWILSPSRQCNAMIILCFCEMHYRGSYMKSNSRSSWLYTDIINEKKNPVLWRCCVPLLKRPPPLFRSLWYFPFSCRGGTRTCEGPVRWISDNSSTRIRWLLIPSISLVHSSDPPCSLSSSSWHV